MQNLDPAELARLSPEERLALIGQLWIVCAMTTFHFRQRNRPNWLDGYQVSIKIGYKLSHGNSCAPS